MSIADLITFHLLLMLIIYFLFCHYATLPAAAADYMPLITLADYMLMPRLRLMALIAALRRCFAAFRQPC